MHLGKSLGHCCCYLEANTSKVFKRIALPVKAQAWPKDAFNCSSHKTSQGFKTCTSGKQATQAPYRHLRALTTWPGEKQARKSIPEGVLPREQKWDMTILVAELPSLPGGFSACSQDPILAMDQTDDCFLFFSFQMEVFIVIILSLFH